MIKRWSWVLGVTAFLLILFSFISPWLFTMKGYSSLDFSKTGQIGDTIGGLMNPFIGTAGIILTFLAFYLQYKANQIQIENFNRQLDLNKNQFEKQLKEDKVNFERQLSEQRNQFLKTQIESQFFEMIRLHKENVKEISLTIHSHKLFTQKEDIISGRSVFSHFLKEVELIYTILRKNCKKQDQEYLAHLAYHYFFKGLQYPLLNAPPKEKCFQDSFEDFKKVNERVIRLHDNTTPIGQICGNPLLGVNHNILIGHSNFLGHYYRHLFHTVKFIANQDEGFMPYEEKRKYLRLLRAQLSNEEQGLLFYNWKSDYGKNWESEVNKFFTDYRMIHNLNSSLLHYDFELSKEFNLDKGYRVESGRRNDFLFEFQKGEE
ncbi:MAG: putative phage abortive infection protein [Bacteroidota bacterium]